MTVRRTLTLKSERLGELTDAQLRDVHGAAATRLCPSEYVAHCNPSDYFVSLCGCLTNYCSIDVC